MASAMRTILIFTGIAATAISMAQCCGTKPTNANEKFLHEAHLMVMKAEGKTPCCKSTATKPVVKGSMGCCKAPGANKMVCKDKGEKLVKDVKARKKA